MRAWFALLLAAALCLAGPLAAQTLDALMERAKAGDGAAQFELAERYRQGSGVVQSYGTALTWYTAAADNGDARALNGLGALYIEGLGVEPDPQRGFDYLAAAARSGEAEHLFDLGAAHEKGLGTPVDPAKAAEFYERAAEQGLVEAAVSLGLLYQDGVGVAQDFARARDLYIGPAEAGHARAQNNLGLLYVRGNGVAQDFGIAATWFSRAADQGLPTALNNLGALYDNGFGVELDEERAKALYRLAAQISAGAAPGLAAPYFDPRFAAPQPVLLGEYIAAAELGDPVGAYLAGYLIYANAASADNLGRAAELFDLAAARGVPAAMVNLGLLSFEGRGVLQDYVTGYKWLTLAAARQGDLAGLRDAFAAKLTASQINEAAEQAELAWAAMN